MDELTLDNEIFVSTKRAAKITGYAKDYVGQLCREGRVQARLVGRNWYVLESSIREHRFGAEEKEKNNPVKAVLSENASSWNAPQYESEAVTELPGLEKETIELPDLSPNAISSVTEPVLENLEPESAEGITNEYVNSSEVLQEMQSAWQDWFKRENQEKVVDEVIHEELLQAPRSIENVYEIPQFIAEPEEKEEKQEEIVPISIQRSPTVQEIEEKVTPIAIEEVTPVAVYKSYSRPELIQAPTAPLRPYTEKEYTPPSTRRTKPNRRKKGRDVVVIREDVRSSLFFKLFFLGLAVVSIGIAIIGSGYFDTYFSQASLKYYPIQYLGGERVLNK